MEQRAVYFGLLGLISFLTFRSCVSRIVVVTTSNVKDELVKESKILTRMLSFPAYLLYSLLAYYWLFHG